jgi:glutathione S-transferase
VGYIMSVLSVEDARGYRDFAALWGFLRSVGRTIASGMFGLDPSPRPGHTALDQLIRHEVEACKHPEESLLEIRSDVFTKGELVATLCTACDGQLGPEVWQAVMDRRFDEWTREHQTKLEADEAREVKNAELRAEAADLAALSVDVLQYFLSDGKETLAKMRWGVSPAQDAKRTELANSCQKWRAELERRGIKEVPSWRRRIDEKLAAKNSNKEDFDASSIAEEFLRPQLEALTKRADLIVGTTYQNLITSNIQMIARTYCIPEVQIRQSPIYRLSSIMQLHQAGTLSREAALAILENDDEIREAYEVSTWGSVEPVRVIEVKPAPKVSWDW